jgi:hypothetical protein
MSIRTERMARLIPDDLLAEVAIAGPFSELGSRLRERYEGVFDRVSLYFPVPADDPDEKWAGFVTAFRKG